MIIVTRHFRCDLCGKHKNLGVTEEEPSNPTAICAGCVREAMNDLLDRAEKIAEPKPRGASRVLPDFAGGR